MKYPAIETIISICEPRLTSLEKEYRTKFNEEIKDLKKWSLFLQTDKASDILKLQGQNSPTNKSGSLILFLIGATSVDPVQNNLKTLKQKFGKADPPDIDIDFNPSIRDEVKRFLVEKFGSEHVCSVGTVGTYKTKNVIQDVARALGLDINDAITVTKNLDGEIGEGDEETKLDKASFDEICSFQPELKNYFEKHEDVRRHSEILRNQAKNYGTHAGGVIISNLDITNKIPVFRDKEGRIVSAWAESGDHQELSSVGFIKFDALGLCLEENTLIATNEGNIPIKFISGKRIKYLNHNKVNCQSNPKEYLLICTGWRQLLKLTFDDGTFVKCSADHKWFRVIDDKIEVVMSKDLKEQDSLYGEKANKKIVKISEAGRGHCYDITLSRHTKLFMGEPNFILGNGLVSHNCNLPVIDDCLKNIKENRGLDIRKSDIPIDDKESIRLGTKGDLFGIFQFENPYTKKISDKVGVDCLNDIAAITSLIRPGPKDVGLDIEYALRKNGKKYDKNPILDKVLGNTFGVLTYQEQVNLLGIHMAGMSPLKANALRKACSKKKADLMAQLKPEFIQGSVDKCVKTGIMTQEQVESIWDMIESTASYSFNRSHAIAYSAITTVELWLRHHYFHEYMTSLIQNADPAAKKFGETFFDKYIKYAIAGGVKVHKPDVNLSGEKFRLRGTDLWFGMGHVKNVSSSAKAIEEFQPYSSVDDFYERCKVKIGDGQKERRPNSRVVESLIYSGAFDRFGTREQVMKRYYVLSGKVKNDKIPKTNAEIRSYIIPEIDDVDGEWVSYKKKLTIIKKFPNDSEIYELVNPIEYSIEFDDLPPLDEKTLEEKEKEMLGILFSENLAIKCREISQKFGVFTLRSSMHQPEKRYIKVLGKIERINEYTSKNGNNYLKVKITDGLWDYSFSVWASSINDFTFQYRVGDIAIIPLQNRGEDDDHPNDRSFNSRGQGKIIERDGIPQDD